MIHIYKKSLKDAELKSLDKFAVGSWVHAEDPSAAEMERLEAELSLSRGLITDALDPFEVPRMETEKNIVYIFTRVPHKIDDRLTTLPLLVALGENFLLTVSKKPVPFLVKFIEGSVDFSTTQKTKFFLQIFKEITTTYGRFMMDIGRRVRSSSVYLGNISNKDIVQFITYEETLDDFVSSLAPTSTILSNLLSGKYLTLYAEDKDLIEDLFLSAGQLLEAGRSNLKMIVNIRNGYSAILTNNLNTVIKLLTVLTIVLAIPTMIASFYGMNVPLPLGASPYAFSLVLGISVVVSAALIWFFVRKRWF